MGEREERDELQRLRDQLARKSLDLDAANAALERLGEASNFFVSIVAHELRAPLAAVQANLELALDGEYGALTPDLNRCMGILQEGLDRMKGIVVNLLDVSRLEANGLDLSLDLIDLADALETVAEEFLPFFAGRGQDFTLSLPPFPALSLCDEARAAQIVRNLLSNAGKYTPRGGRIEMTLESAETGDWLIRVSDTGIGIQSDDRPHLFTRFFRGDSARQTDAIGVGLGLYITRALVELHGGRIWFESIPGQGSTFYVTLPAGELPPDPGEQ